jgi:RNA polymerase sigma-70 factor, ECF subfamily
MCSPVMIDWHEGVVLDSGSLASAEILTFLPYGMPSLYRTAYRFLRNKADAEDAVQDALLAACKHFNQFRGDAQLSTWLTAIVTNCARMQLRKRPRRVLVSLDSRLGEEQEYSLSDVLLDHRPNPEDECHTSRLSARLMECTQRLSPALRKTFYLRYVDNLSISKTAEALGIPIGTAKARLARARAALMKSMRLVLHLVPSE